MDAWDLATIETERRATDEAVAWEAARAAADDEDETEERIAA